MSEDKPLYPTDPPPESGRDPEPLPESPETPPPRLNVFQRFVGVFANPRLTFADIIARPEWVVPLIILVLASVIMVQLSLPAITADQERALDRLVEEGRITPEQAEQGREARAAATRSMAVIFAGLGTVFYAVLIAAALLFIGNIVLRGKASYRQMFSVYAWSGLVGVLGMIIRLPLIRRQNTMQVQFSPATFFPEEASETVLYRIAASLDVFLIWQLVLVAVAFTLLYRVGMGKALGVLAAFYAVLVAIGIIVQGMF
ncbi:MAG: YIP1 family protein [Candidatus Zixiibacteriota bacterium]|nr:MAG: YIP1 family protein [candidate division Zixibacteria bacterium]